MPRMLPPLYLTELHIGRLVVAGRQWTLKRNAERAFQSLVEGLQPRERAFLKVREPDGSVQLLASFPNAEEEADSGPSDQDPLGPMLRRVFGW